MLITARRPAAKAARVVRAAAVTWRPARTTWAAAGHSLPQALAAEHHARSDGDFGPKLVQILRHRRRDLQRFARYGVTHAVDVRVERVMGQLEQ